MRRSVSVLWYMDKVCWCIMVQRDGLLVYYGTLRRFVGVLLYSEKVCWFIMVHGKICWCIIVHVAGAATCRLNHPSVSKPVEKGGLGACTFYTSFTD